MSWSLNEVLADPVASATFRAYLVTRYAAENYDFLTEVAAYKQAPSWATAREIYARYVADAAARQANMSGESRAGIEARLPEQPGLALPPADLFDKAANDVANADYFTGFLQTPQGTKYGGDNSPYKDALNRILDNNDAAGAFYKDTMDREAREGRPRTALTRNIDFLLAVRAYKTKPRETRARAIYDHYVVAGGPLSLPLLPSATRAAIAQRMPPVRWTARFRTGPVDLFNTAQSNISGAIAYLVPDFHQRVGDAQFALWVGDEPPGGMDDDGAGGLDQMGDDLAGGEIAEGGDNGINPPPPAPDPAPDVNPPEPPAGPDAHDDPGRDPDHDESNSDGRVEVVERV